MLVQIVRCEGAIVRVVWFWLTVRAAAPEAESFHCGPAGTYLSSESRREVIFVLSPVVDRRCTHFAQWQAPQRCALIPCRDLDRALRSRLIAFADVAMGAVIELNEVELLLMKAMSLGLIKGRIDEVCAAASHSS